MGEDAELENARVADEEERGAKEIEDAWSGNAMVPVREIMRRFIDRPDPWHKKEPNVYHASDVWYCLRKGVYKYATDVIAAEPPHGVFESGRRAEDAGFEALQHHYGKEFVVRGLPIEIDRSGYKIVGKTDPVLLAVGGLLGPRLRLKALFEFKSVARGGTDYQSGEHHKRQVSLYAIELMAERTFIVHPGRADYLDMGQRELNAEETKFYYNSALEYFDLLHAAVVGKREKNILPEPKPYHNWECRYCPFLAQCKTDGGPGKVDK